MISTEIKRLQDGKASIRQSIISKGVDVPDTALLNEYSGYIDKIEGGEGGPQNVEYGDWDSSSSFVNAIKKVKVPSSATTIPNKFFDSASAMTDIDMSNVETIGASAFTYCSGLTEIHWPSTLKSVGDYAFSYCKGLTDLYIPNVNYGSYVFNYCSNINNVTFDKGLSKIPYGMFYNCYIGGTLEIPDNITDIETGAFYGNDFTSITMSDSVTYISTNAFGGNRELTNIRLSESITGISSSLFSTNYKLDNVHIPASVTSIGERAFYQCSGLTSIDLSQTAVKSIGNDAFSQCYNLADIKFSDSINSIGTSGFSHCRAFTEVSLPSTISSIGNYAFAGCTALTEVTIEGYINKLEDYTFSGCTKLNKLVLHQPFPPTIGYNFPNYALNYIRNNNGKIIVPCDSLTAYQNASYWSSYSAYMECDSSMKQDTENYSVHLVTSNYGDLYYPCTSTINANAYSSYTTGVTSIEIGDCVETVGNNAFSGLTRVESIDFGNGVRNIGASAFTTSTGSCNSITFGDNLETIGARAFQGNRYVTSIAIPASVTSIGDYAFSGCTGITELVFEGDIAPTFGSSILGTANTNLKIYCNCAMARSLENANNFSTYKAKINLIDYDPVEVTVYEYKRLNGEIYEYKTDECVITLTTANTRNNLTITDISGDTNPITSITLHEGIVKIGEMAFSGFNKVVQELDIPDSVGYIDSSAFIRCSGITGDLIFGDNLTVIESNTFKGCTGLNGKVVFGKKLRYLGTYCFDECPNIQSFEFTSPKPPSSINNTSISGNQPIYIPKGSLNEYLSDSTIRLYYADRLVEKDS